MPNDRLAVIQQRLNQEAALHNPPEALYEPSPGQLLDHVHHRIAKIAADTWTDREHALVHALRSERRRWNAVRQYALQTEDSGLNEFLDKLAAEYADSNDIVEPDGWVWRPKAGDGRWQFRRTLEGRTFSKDAEVVPVKMLDDWKPVQ